MKETLTIHIEDDQGRKSELSSDSEVILIGRHKDSAIHLDERNISRKHARVLVQKEGTFLEDLDSSNGTRINGQKVVSPMAIFTEDKIQIGDYVLCLSGPLVTQRTEEITKRKGFRPLEEITQTDPCAEEPQEEESRHATRKSDFYDEDNTEVIFSRAPESIILKPAKLVCIAGPFAGKEWSFPSKNRYDWVIGRGDECDIVINHKSISRQHARIIFDDGFYTLMDLKSANGLLIEGQNIHEAELADGQVFEIGRLQVKLVYIAQDLTDEEDVYEKTAVNEDLDFHTVRMALPKKRRTAQLIAIGTFILVVITASTLALWPHRGDSSAKNGDTRRDQLLQTKLAEAQILMEKEEFAQALAVYTHLLSEQPGNSSLQSLQLRAQEGRDVKAIYEEALKQIDEGELSAARELLQKIPSTSLFHGRATQTLTELEQRVARMKKEIIDEEKIKQEEKSKQEKIAQQKKAEQEKSDPAKSAESGPDKSNPQKEAEERFNEGKVALKAGDTNQAIQLFLKAVRLSPKYALPHRNLGVAYAKIGENTASIEHYRMYLALNPKATDAEQVRAIIQGYESSGD